MDLPLAAPLPGRLRADCAACHGWCCVAPAFDADQGFGYDKPAHSACRHLGTDGRCRVHAQRAALGFAGCIEFDCLGAGQRLSAARPATAAGWRDDAAARGALCDTFLVLKRLHHVLAQLWLVAPLAAPAQRTMIEHEAAQLEALAAAVARGEVGAAQAGAAEASVQALLRPLRRGAAADAGASRRSGPA